MSGQVSAQMTGVRLMTWAARGATAAALALAGAGALLWLAQRPWFDLRRIEVSGDLRHVSRAAIRSAIAGRLAGNFFTMRLDDARRAFESVPWVAAVSVRRVWPNRLGVELTEHRALGTWSDGRLLSDAGVLFVANPAEAELDGPQIEFSGPERFAADAARRYRQFAAMLAPVQIRIAGLEVSERASWALRADPVRRIELGRDEPAGELQRRLAAIVAGYPLVAAQLNGAPSRVDARYPNGFAAATP
jgi:cell division protein FtsQ